MVLHSALVTPKIYNSCHLLSPCERQVLRWVLRIYYL